jgi:hypothetical protein
MALLTLIPSTATFAEGSQTLSTVNTLITQLNANTGLGAIAQGAFVANGAVASTVTSLGPAGSSTTIRKWLSIVDNTGTTVFLPCF